MILLITPSAPAQKCAKAIEEATSQPTQLAESLHQAAARLRSEEYSAVVIDQFLLEANPDESDLLLQHLDTAVPVYVNLAISGVDRMVREVRLALHRRKREETVARQSAQDSLRSELKGTLTAMLLSCELALGVPDLPPPAAEKIRTVHTLAREVRTRLGISG